MTYWEIKADFGYIFLIYALILFFLNIKKDKQLTKALEAEFEKDTFPVDISTKLASFGFRQIDEDDDKIAFKKMPPNNYFAIAMLGLILLSITVIPLIAPFSHNEVAMGLALTIIFGLIIFYFPMRILGKKVTYILDKKNKTFTKTITYKRK